MKRSSAIWIVVSLGLQAQTGVVRPEFNEYRIGPAYGRVWPGDIASIYGWHLAPEQPCERHIGPYPASGRHSSDDYERVRELMPAELCGVQVLMDEEPLPLLYVQERQINFLVPLTHEPDPADGSGKVTLRVLHRGVSSIPVRVKYGPDRMQVVQEEPAYAGIAVWVRVANLSDGNRPVELPFGIPRVFTSSMCPHLEVRFEGTLLPELEIKSPPFGITYAGPPCPAPQLPKNPTLAGRIPLHLRYLFDRPGTYEVRYAPGAQPFLRGTHNPAPTTAESDWTAVQVQASAAEQRSQWLRHLVAQAPSDPEALIYDFLPSIFGYGDPAAMQIGLPYLYHPDPAVSAAAAEYLADYYTPSQLRPALETAVKTRGTNQNIDALLRDLRPH